MPLHRFYTISKPGLNFGLFLKYNEILNQLALAIHQLASNKFEIKIMVWFYQDDLQFFQTFFPLLRESRLSFIYSYLRFHKECIQKFASTAGYFFKCPLCNNKEIFESEMQSFGVYVPDTEDHLIKSVKFEDGHGRVFGPYTKMSTSFDLINYKTPNIAGPLPSFLTNTEARIQSGGWKYQIEWFEHAGDPVKSVIVVSSGVSDVAGVTVTCWMSRKQWSQVSQFQYITLFARVSTQVKCLTSQKYLSILN